MSTFIHCQAYVVLFIGLHDWLPLGRFNNLKRIRAADTMPQLLLTTLWSVLPFWVLREGTLPAAELLEAMGKCNEELRAAGIIQAADGLKPSSQGSVSRLMAPTEASSTDPSPRPRS